MLKFLKQLFGNRELGIIEKEIDIEPYEKTSFTTEEIINKWKLTDLKLNDPATLNQIIETERKTGINFPDDFKKFYYLINGFKDWDMTAEMFCIWDLERIAEEFEKSDKKDFIPFCDYFINCHQIGYVKNRVGVYKAYYDDIDYKIAETFEETLQLIANDSELLY
jgi:SMI1 / KNR4 family (SUKH-1)